MIHLEPYPPLSTEMAAKNLFSRNDFKIAAVAVCLKNGDPTDRIPYALLLIRRSYALHSFPGVISFPGGKFEKGDWWMTGCAIRELNEETSLLPQTILGTLTPVMASDFSHHMTPSVFLLGKTDEPVIHPGGEISEAFWIRPSDVHDRKSPLIAEIPVPILSIIIEITARLSQWADQARSPKEWFYSHNSFQYMYRQWESALNLVASYPDWLAPIEHACGEKARVAFQELIAIHDRQANDLQEFLGANDLAYRPIHTNFAPRESFYFNALFQSVGLSFDSRAFLSWKKKEWQKVFQLLFVTYSRGLERYLGLRRVRHVEIPVHQTIPFWSANRVWSRFMADAFFNAHLMRKICEEPTMNEGFTALFQLEKDIMDSIWQYQDIAP